MSPALGLRKVRRGSGQNDVAPFRDIADAGERMGAEIMVWKFRLGLNGWTL